MSKKTPLVMQTSIHSAVHPNEHLDHQPTVPAETIKPSSQARCRTPSKRRYVANEYQEELKPLCLPQQSRLETLPTDVLYFVATMLPGEAVYALSLTSKSMSCFFDRQQLLSRDPLAKKRFLLCMETRRPDYLLCYTCDRLYRWKTPGEKKPRLCPGRKFTPHHDYGRLDIKQHDRRVPREIIDLALRSNKKTIRRGTRMKTLVKSLQERESFDRHLRMKAQSHVMTTIMSDCMLVTMELGVRIPLNDILHPLRWLAVETIPQNDSVKPPAHEFRHPRFSSVTRGLGCNFHELLMLENVQHGTESIFLACQNCKTSVRIARSNLFNKWISVNIKTTQAFGSREDLLGDTLHYTGFTDDHRKEHPDEVMHFMNCSTSVPDQPAFALDTSEGNTDHDLSLNAWFNRHVHVRTQRFWPETTTPEPENEADDNNGDDDDTDDNDEQEQTLPPVFSEEECSTSKPKTVSCKSLGFRKQWFLFAIGVPTLCIVGPIEIFRSIKKRVTASRGE